MSEELEGTWTLEQRVQIAKDVLARLDARSMVVKDGEGYLEMNRKGLRSEGSPISGVLHSDSLGAVCEVCARGAMFLCAVDRYNSITVDYGQNLALLAQARSWEGLGIDQAGAIEAAFERWDNSDAAAFGDLYDDPDARLRAICQNMIDNGGLFISPAREDDV